MIEGIKKTKAQVATVAVLRLGVSLERGKALS
jgi:hypothetical protein